MSSLRKLYTYLFFIGWFFFPFNDFEGIKEFGEFKNESGAFFFIAGFVFLLIEALRIKKISIPYKNLLFGTLLLFFAWCIITILINFNAVCDSYFKHTGGIVRFIRQFFSLLVSAFIFFIFYWNVIIGWNATRILNTIRKVLLIGLVFVFFYGFIETLIIYFHIGALRPVLGIFDYFPFLDVNYQPDGRISSVAYESPSLGNYLITISGWMFSYIFTEKGKSRFIPTLMVLFLTFFSGSRTAFINIGLQLVILFSVLYSMHQYRGLLRDAFKYTLLATVVLLFLNGDKITKAFTEKAESLNFRENLTKSVSNQSRFGMQYASLQVFKDHPITGVGFGQETYYKRFYYPRWAKKDNYEFKLKYENKNDRSFPTAYNIYTRLLAETGIIGFLIFSSLIYLCIKKALLVWKKGMDEEKTLGLILIISFAGLSLNWMQTDFFRQHGFWLCMAILIKLLGDIKKRNKITP